MLGKKKSCQSCQECVKQKLVTVYDYSIETTISGENGEEVTVLSAESAENKCMAAIQANNNLLSDFGRFLKNGQNELLSTEYYTVSKVTVNEIDSRQVLVDV